MCVAVIPAKPTPATLAASEIARPVFGRAGYAVLHRQDFAIPFEDGEVPIHNYAMEKHLG